MVLRISWSGLRTHTECKQRGYLTRAKKKATLENGRNFFPGTVTDRVVRDWLDNDPAAHLGAMPDMVEEYVNREKNAIDEGEQGIMLWKDSGDKKAVIEDCIEAVTKIEPILIKKVLPYEWQPDFRFDTDILLPHPDGGMDRAILIGYLDILVRDPADGSFSIYDVKHTRDDSYYRKTSGQLGFYDIAVGLTFDAPVREVGLFQPLCKEPDKVIPVTKDTKSQMMQSIVGMADDIWRNDNAPRKDYKLCGYCSVKHACIKFKPAMIDGKARISFSR